MFEQLQKGVSKVETGILEYVAKKQASNVLQSIEQPVSGKDTTSSSYFDKLKKRLFNNEEQTVSQSNDMIQDKGRSNER